MVFLLATTTWYVPVQDMSRTGYILIWTNGRKGSSNQDAFLIAEVRFELSLSVQAPGDLEATFAHSPLRTGQGRSRLAGKSNDLGGMAKAPSNTSTGSNLTLGMPNRGDLRGQLWTDSARIGGIRPGQRLCATHAKKTKKLGTQLGAPFILALLSRGGWCVPKSSQRKKTWAARVHPF